MQRRGLQLYQKMMAQTDPHEFVVFFSFSRFPSSFWH